MRGWSSVLIPDVCDAMELAKSPFARKREYTPSSVSTRHDTCAAERNGSCVSLRRINAVSCTIGSRDATSTTSPGFVDHVSTYGKTVFNVAYTVCTVRVSTAYICIHCRKSPP